MIRCSRHAQSGERFVGTQNVELHRRSGADAEFLAGHIATRARRASRRRPNRSDSCSYRSML